MNKALLDAIELLLVDSSLSCNMRQELIGRDVLPASSSQSELLFTLFGMIFKKGVPGLPSTSAAADGGIRTRNATLSRVVTTADLQPDKNDIEFASVPRALEGGCRFVPNACVFENQTWVDAVMFFGEARLCLCS